MSQKIVIEKLNNIIQRNCNALLAFHFEDGQLEQIDYCDDSSIVGNIYVGYVKNVIGNLGGAFIEFDDGVGYFSAKDEAPIYLNNKNSDNITAGDKVLIQVSKDKLKTKDYTVTSKIELTGTMSVFISNGCIKNELRVGQGIRISGKIKDSEFKKELVEEINKDEDLYRALYQSGSEIVIRTNAYGQPFDTIINDIKSQVSLFQHIAKNAEHRTKGELVHKAESQIVDVIKNIYWDNNYEIVIEDKEVAGNICEKLDTDIAKHIRIYEDKLLPMSKLYSLEKLLDNALGKKVWLKSGAYIVIEPTEALVSIDVNTGKRAKGAKKANLYLNTNLEAAEEIARQIKIRNLSGIIIVDFINMTSEEDNEILISKMKKLLMADRVITNVAGMSNLGLMEITRKKMHKPLYEYIR